MKNTIIVRTGILKTKRDKPKHNVPSPRIDSQRVAVSNSIPFSQDIFYILFLKREVLFALMSAGKEARHLELDPKNIIRIKTNIKGINLCS